MKHNILLWYRRSEIEQVLEMKLIKYNLELSFPNINYGKDKIEIDRTVKLMNKKSMTEIKIFREFYLNQYCENIQFGLGEAERATIYYFENIYTASCYILNTNKSLFKMLKKQKNLDICIREELDKENIIGYFIQGNIKRLTGILVDYLGKKTMLTN